MVKIEPFKIKLKLLIFYQDQYGRKVVFESLCQRQCNFIEIKPRPVCLCKTLFSLMTVQSPTDNDDVYHSSLNSVSPTVPEDTPADNVFS